MKKKNLISNPPNFGWPLFPVLAVAPLSTHKLCSWCKRKGQRLMKGWVAIVAMGQNSFGPPPAWKGNDWLDITGIKVPNSWLLPHPLCYEARQSHLLYHHRPPPAKPVKDSTIHQQLCVAVYPLTYSWSLGLPHCLRRWRKSNQDTGNRPNSRSPALAVGGTRCILLWKAGSFLVGFSKVNTPKTRASPRLTATWDLYFERRVQWFESSSNKQHKCSYYKFGIKGKPLLRHESLSYSSLKFPQ